MKKTLFMIPFLLIYYGKLYSQDLKWEDIVAIAEKNNPELIAARTSVESSRFSVRSALGDFLPQLSGNGSYSKSSTGKGATQNDYSLSLAAQQSLFSGFRSRANLNSAKARFAGTQAALALEESQVLNDLRSSFLNLLYAQENIRLLKSIRDRKEANKKLIELRYEAGRENRGAFLRANAQLSQSQFELDQAERALRLAQSNLARNLGQDPGSAHHIIGSFEIKSENESPNFAVLSVQTPQYKRSQADVASAHSGLVQAKSDFYPSLSLSVSGRRSGNSFPLDNDSWSAGGTVSLPFFSGGSHYHGVRQAQSEITRTSYELESLRRQIMVSLEDAFVKFQDAAAQVEIQKQFLEASEERAKIARAQYNNGLISYQDWDLIENDLTNTEKQTLESLRRAGLAESAWNQSQGKGLYALQ